MKRIKVTNVDVYLIDISDEDYEDLQNGNADATEFLDSETAYWKNGSCDYYLVGEV